MGLAKKSGRLQNQQGEKVVSGYTMIKRYQSLILAESELNNFRKTPVELYEPIAYMLSLGGKRLRPVLVLMSAELFGIKAEQALKAAMAIETFHNFTLMHDDIMDNAPLRRGKQTVHERWNINTAILSGDVMLVESYKLLMYYEGVGLGELLNLFNRTATEVCEGQQIDMNFEHRDDVYIPEYIQMIRLKTAVLLGAALQMGAIIANASKEDAERIYTFGVNLGIAFQLQDDYLDLYADPDKFGKQVGGDILSNKKTYMLVKAMELAVGRDKQELDFWLNAKIFKAEDKIEAVKQIYNRLNITDYIAKEKQHYVQLAFGQLDAIKGAADTQQIKMIREFAEGSLIREV